MHTPPPQRDRVREETPGGAPRAHQPSGLPRATSPDRTPNQTTQTRTGHRYRSVQPPLRQSRSSLCTPARHGLCCSPSLCKRPNTSQPTHLATWRQTTEPERPPAEGGGGGGPFLPRAGGWRPTSAAAAAAVAAASAIAFARASAGPLSPSSSSAAAAELLPLCRELVLAGLTSHSANDGACTAAPATVDVVAAIS